MKVCDYCLENDCKGEMNCDCSTCDKYKECFRKLHAIIRITTKCTQSCKHCCFECSPKSNDFMNIETAEKIKQFLISNEIKYISLMGGEFYCHSEWKEIFNLFLMDGLFVRVVTNGDWADKNGDEVGEYFTQYPGIRLSISEDNWHTNKHIQKAKNICLKYNIDHNLGNHLDDDENAIVPVGRSMFSSFGFYSMIAQYCENPQKRYSFLIDENGDIYKCGFGIWKYTNISNHLDESFPKKFQEFNKKFRSIFFGNCRNCLRSHERYKIV